MATRAIYSKCSKCGKSFPTSSMQKKGTKKYCNNCIDSVNQESEDYKELIDYIYTKLFERKEPPKLIFKQIADLKEKYKWTYIGMLYSLKWYYEVECNPINSDNYHGVGLIEFIYDDAKKYYADYLEKCSRLEQINFSSEETNVVVNLNEINKIQFEITRVKNLIDISEIGGDIDE